MKTIKNLLKAIARVIIGIALVYSVTDCIAQTTPTILIDGSSVMASNVSVSPYWLASGQTLAIGNLTKFISVLQYSVVPAVSGGNNLQFENVISVTTAQTVPSGKVWKVESVAVDPTAAFFGGDNLGNHIATTTLNMNSNKISNLSNPTNSNDAVNATTVQNSSVVYAAAGGTANAITVTLSPAPAVYAAGMLVSFKAGSADNTAAVTINVNSLGAKTIKKSSTVDLVSGDIKAGQMVNVIYDGTNFQMLSSSGNSGSSGPSRFYIGDYYGGGVVIYVDSTTQHGIIAAKSTQSSGISWSNIQNSAVGPSAQSFTNGVTNTTAIEAQPGHTNSAAKVCDDYANEGYTDWYLPSANELGAVCRLQGLLFKITFYTAAANSLYWSSTENSLTDPSTRAVGVDFATCTQQLNDNNYGMQKFQSYKVWCIRSF